MNVKNYFNKKKCFLFNLYYFNYIISFSDDLKSPFKDLTKENFVQILQANGKNGVVERAVDFYFEKDGKLTEDGKILKKKLDEKLKSMYGEKNPNFENIEFKDLIQAAVIGFPDKEQDPGTKIAIIDTVVYYKEYVNDPSKPLVVWFHGNGSSYDSWPWGDDNIRNYLKNVLAIEYPSYVRNGYSTFEEIDKYTTAVAEFLKQHIERIMETEPNKKVILFSHSFGCNVNTLVYSKLKEKMNNLDLRSILIFPYYNAIDASVNVLKNAKKLGVGRCEDTDGGNILDNFIPAFEGNIELVGFGNTDSIIKDFVYLMYERLFKNNKKNESQNELQYIESVSNNGEILTRGSVKLEDVLLVKNNVDHCGWNYNMILGGKKLIDILKNGEDISLGEDKKNIIIVFSDNDNVVGKGGLHIANHFINAKVNYNTKELYSQKDHKDLKGFFQCMGYNLTSKDEINELINLQNSPYYDYNAINDIKKQGICQCCRRIQEEEKNGIKDAAGDYIDRKNNN